MELITFLAGVIDWGTRVAAVFALSGTILRELWKRQQRRIVRGVFGGSEVTTYFPLRTLEGRSAIAEADFQAANQLSAFLAKYGVTVTFRFITNATRINFDRTGVVLICGPKSSEAVERALAEDDCISFLQESGRYVLVDHIEQKKFSSRRDIHEFPSDVGYLARHRESSKKRRSFISIAGIHAEGSAIVVDYLCDMKNLRELYKKTNNSLFSAVVGGTYKSDPLEVDNSKLLTLYQRTPVAIEMSDLAVIESLHEDS